MRAGREGGVEETERDVVTGERQVVSVNEDIVGVIRVGENCFFQAEDGIRDSPVTGVQTCALPICQSRMPLGQIG